MLNLILYHTSAQSVGRSVVLPFPGTRQLCWLGWARLLLPPAPPLPPGVGLVSTATITKSIGKWLTIANKGEKVTYIPKKTNKFSPKNKIEVKNYVHYGPKAWMLHWVPWTSH